MKFGIIVRRLAERGLEEAEDWYNRQRNGLGSEFRQTIDGLLARLAENPGVYPRVHGEVHRAVLRRFPYLVYFLIDSSDRQFRCGRSGSPG